MAKSKKSSAGGNEPEGDGGSERATEAPVRAKAVTRKAGGRRRRTTAARTATKQAAKPRRRRRRRAVAAASMSKMRKPAQTRRRYTPDERARILGAARREGLTGAQVSNRYGISEVTYYLWRKNARPALRQAVRNVRDSGVFDLAEQIRDQLRDQVQRAVPDVVRREIDLIFSDLRAPRRRKR